MTLDTQALQSVRYEASAGSFIDVHFYFVRKIATELETVVNEQNFGTVTGG